MVYDLRVYDYDIYEDVMRGKKCGQLQPVQVRLSWSEGGGRKVLPGVFFSRHTYYLFSNFASLSYILSLSLEDIEILFAFFFAARFGTIALDPSLNESWT